MQNELQTLEQKVMQLVQIHRQLRAENAELRQELAAAQSMNRQYEDKIEAAAARLEKLMVQLPE
ncbi:MAG: hypothetical protein AB1400_11355 [Pseudomonadota bacterium]|jgi:cell division protein ZapB